MLVFGLVAAIALSFVPTPYVVQQPGPVYDTLGTVEIDEVETELIDIDAQTYDTSGSLSLLTVNVVGSRATRVGWFTVVQSWFDPSRSVVPLDSVYPEGTSFEEAEEASRVDMENSKSEAVAAALRALDYEVDGTLTIASTVEGYPADGVVEPGDTILTVGGERYTDVTALRSAFEAHGTADPVSISLLRDGSVVDVELTPVMSPGPQAAPIIGVGVQVRYEYPIAVDISLDSVGGPSAGMMFALGIVDKLTPGEATGGADVAGTGTITGTGEVGAIGGVRQKMYGAVESGADWMLVPAGNCDEVAGNEPDGLTVVPVATLDEALSALEAIADGEEGALASCE